jgi:DNA-binding SARP family transcriptional activator/tetratricopeptide (TPR) repeat protein
VAKLRASGEVAELRTDDLRFDVEETARLFSETYGRPLEPDVLADLSARTEGWAASLQLVQAALRDRSPSEIRSIVRNLTGEDHELYDYLAEEVVGDLPDELQGFLMRTSVLHAVTPTLAALVTDLPTERVRSLATQAERLGLLARRGRTIRDPVRYHPLVRDFLEARLRRALGSADSFADLHLRVANATATSDWRLACHHFVAAGRPEEVGRVIDEAVEGIIAQGDLMAAEAYVVTLDALDPRASYDVIRSRTAFRRGEHAKALAHAKAAAELAPVSPIVLTNLESVALGVGDLELVAATAQRFAQIAADDDLRAISDYMVQLVGASTDGHIPELLSSLRALRRRQRARGHAHYEAVTSLNIAVMEQALGNAAPALEAADAALALFDEVSAHGVEHAAAHLVRAWALAHLGDLAAARAEIARGIDVPTEMAQCESLIEAAQIETWYGDADVAARYLADAAPMLARQPWLKDLFLVVSALLASRRGLIKDAERFARQFRVGRPSQVTCIKAMQLATQALVAVRGGQPSASTSAGLAVEQARAQGAIFWVRSAELIAGAAARDLGIGHLLWAADFDAAFLSIHAELVVDLLEVMPSDAREVVRAEAQRRPERWRSPLRKLVDRGELGDKEAAQILDVIGTREDIDRLRRLGRRLGRGPQANLGRGLARRLAPRIFIEDQGRLAVRIGDKHVEGTTIRRKVLALLAFLLTRPRFSATRDEVLDALWPEAEPSVALNSLNQTVYFLRRVIEAEYREDVSPGYVRHESDVVWLDRQLISSRSQLCLDFIRALPVHPSPDDVHRLVGLYQGQFALDFAYEEWAAGYRDSLHAAYLQVVEQAVAEDTATGHFDRGIAIARRALEIDPGAEQVELSLLRLLRLSGAHAAAAEQYGHYASVLRDTFGIEAPPLESL